MKTNLTKIVLAATGSLLMTALLSAPLLAQDESDEDRQARFEERREGMRERRGEFLENNPEIAAQREGRRQQREEFLENNPDAQARMEERREQMRNGEGRPRGPGGPGPRGRRGPPNGAPGSDI